MLSQKAKDLFAKLEMDSPAVAIKYSYAMPENTTHTDMTLSFCEFVKEAQVTGKSSSLRRTTITVSGKWRSV